MIQNYHSETYLQPLVERGKKQREDLAHKRQIETNQLSPLQQKICQAISLESQNKESYNKKLEDRNRETDNIIVLAEEKLFIVIETKSRLKNQMNSVQTLKKAAEQQKKRRKLFNGDHKNILNRGWRLVTLVAFPFIENKRQAFANKICDSCLDFTLDKNNISNLDIVGERNSSM